MNKFKFATMRRLASVMPLALAACGGGAGGGTTLLGSDGPSFITWNNNANGSVVLLSNNVQVKFTTDGKLYYQNATYGNVTVANGQVYVNGSAFATIVLAPGTNNTQIAEMKCSDGSFVQLTPSGASIALSCAGTGSSPTGTGGSGTGPGGGSQVPPPIACPAGNGSGTNGLSFFSPSGYTSYRISTALANSTATSSLTWGVQYANVNNLSSGSYSGSLRAELWAVRQPYSGGTINGIVLGQFSPNFTGTGARSANQIYVGGYSTTTVNSTGSYQTPSVGSYCLVATLEQYSNGSYYIVDWVQFSGSVSFQ